MRTPLFHFTLATESHLGSILREGAIRTTESNVSWAKGNAGPRVVWTTREAEIPSFPSWGSSRPYDKSEARLTLDVPPGEAFPWQGWARRKGSSAAVMTDLIETGGGGHGAWYVVERPVVLSEIVEVRVRERVWRGEELAALIASAPRFHRLERPWPVF